MADIFEKKYFHFLIDLNHFAISLNLIIIIYTFYNFYNQTYIILILKIYKKTFLILKFLLQFCHN